MDKSTGRKSLGDVLANNFAYGEEEMPVPTPETKTKTRTKSGIPLPATLMSTVIQEAAEKEQTIRTTVDLPKSKHRQLTVLCAKAGVSKQEAIGKLIDRLLMEDEG